jgi:serine/threonine protein kinase
MFTIKFITNFMGVGKDDAPKPQHEQPKLIPKLKPKHNMQIVDSQVVADGDSVQTWVVAHKDSRLYFAINEGHMSRADIEQADPSTWTTSATSLSPQQLNHADVFPGASAEYTEYEYFEDQEVYLKTHRVVQFRRPINLAWTRHREITACEDLRLYPHPNICEYLGKRINVPLDKDRVTKVVFKKYDCNLSEAVTNAHPVDIAHCLRSIAAGLEHLHSIGYVHSDIKPENIFVLYLKADEEDAETAAQYVVGDFDSVQVAGNILTGKAGTPGWARPKKRGDVVDEADDWYAFGELKKWLIVFQDAYMMEFEGIGKSFVEKKVMKGIARRSTIEVRE